MALGISWEELISANATGEYTDPLMERTLRAITRPELTNFNLDLEAIAAQYASPEIRTALEKHQWASLIVARNVMAKAGQPYGGANGMAAEVCMRMILPVDVGYGAGAVPNEENWDTNMSAETLGNVWGFQTGGSTPADHTLAEEEGNIILGWTDPVPDPGVCAYQLVKGGKTFPYFTITFSGCRADSIPFIECMTPIVEFPEEAIRINVIVARLVNPDRLQAIGMHFCRAANIRVAPGSEA